MKPQLILDNDANEVKTRVIRDNHDINASRANDDNNENKNENENENEIENKNENESENENENEYKNKNKKINKVKFQVIQDKVKMRTKEYKSSPTTETIDADKIVSFLGQINKDTGECAYGMLSKDLYDDNTREAFREILKEDLSAQFDDDGIKLYYTFFVLLDK